MMTERLFLFVGTLSSKAFAMLVMGTSAFFSGALGEFITSQVSGAAIAGTIGTCLAAAFLVIPRVMEQRRKSRESNAQLNKDSIAILVSTHDRDVISYRDKIAALELIATLHIKAKHKAVGEWGNISTAYRVLLAQLRDKGITPAMEVPIASYEEIIGETDDKIEAIATNRVAESPTAYVAPPK